LEAGEAPEGDEDEDFMDLAGDEQDDRADDRAAVFAYNDDEER
jgi:hypothetical protein